jgi:hypothetical protein
MYHKKSPLQFVCLLPAKQAIMLRQNTLKDDRYRIAEKGRDKPFKLAFIVKEAAVASGGKKMLLQGTLRGKTGA